MVRLECGGKWFYFFNDPRIFYNAAADMCMTKSRARGIPENKIYKFFHSIFTDSPDKPDIVSCKLKTISNGTPFALFLVEWQVLKKLYHLHVHFCAFNKMIISGVTHVNVTEASDIYRAQFDVEYQEEGKKDYIDPDEDIYHVWEFIDSEQFSKYCKKFITDQGLDWTKRSSWYMEDSKPSGKIRSRCASLEMKLLTSLIT